MLKIALKSPISDDLEPLCYNFCRKVAQSARRLSLAFPEMNSLHWNFTFRMATSVIRKRFWFLPCKLADMCETISSRVELALSNTL